MTTDVYPRVSTVYGPVHSWRVGLSLGIDLICETSVCSFNCTYCQLGNIVRHTGERKIFVPTSKVIEDLRASRWREADIITFSGSGEPTLALNIGECIREIRALTAKPTLVLTNGILLADPQVRRDLAESDRVYVKIDAADQEVFERINRPVEGVSLQGIVAATVQFRREYRGFLGIQSMFTPANIHQAEQMVEIYRSIAPDEVQLNTPTRPYPRSWYVASRGSHDGVDYPAVPLKVITREEAEELEKTIRATTGLPVVSVYQN